MGEQLKMRNKVGYALGTLAKDFISPIWGAYLLYFYTDVFGIGGTAAGLLLFVARIWDAINDPMMGVIVDKTKTKMGRYRPYILLAPIPLYIFAVLTFTTPNLAPTGKLIWAYVTYIGTGMAFTAFDVPMWGMLSTLTNSENDRNQMISYLRVVSTTGYMIMSYITLPLVSVLGRGNEAAGFRNLMIVTCIISYVFALICFFSTKEVYNTSINGASLGDMVKALATNRPLMILMATMVLMFIFQQMPAAVGTYYIMYVLKRPDMVGLGLTLPTFTSYIGIFAAPALAKRFGGKQSTIVAFIAYVVLGVFGFIFAKNSLPLFLATVCLQGVTNGVPSVILSTYITDTSDYSEWKMGVRCDGTAFSLQSFAVKAGQALAGAVGGFVLGMTGYVGGQEVQADSVLTALNVARFIAPAVIALVTVGVMQLYPITAELKAKITAELEKKHAEAK